MTEKRDHCVIGCISQQKKEMFDDYCWKNRTSQSAVLRDLVENLLSSEMKS
jgi:hypothetical protein